MKTTYRSHALALSLLLMSSQAFALTYGNITPASVAMTITGIALIPADGTSSNQAVFSGSQQVTWSAASTDFSGTSFANLTVPEGRYIGAQVTYNTDRTVLLSGYKYRGATNTLSSPNTIANNQYICSAASNSWTYSSSACTSTTSIQFIQAGGANRTYFSQVACVTTSANKASLCKSTDQFIDASVSSNLTFNLLMDMYNNIQINTDLLTVNSSDTTGNNQGIRVNNYPYVVFGGLGAAVHLEYQTGSGTSLVQNDMTLLFDPNKTLIFAYANSWVNSGSVPSGWCNGPGGTRNVTAAATGGTVNPWGISFIGQFDSTAAKAAFSVQDPDTSKGGIVLVSGLSNDASQTASVKCVADDSTAINSWDSNFATYLGWTYTKPSSGLTYSGSEASSALSVNIVKIADSAGILGISTCKGTTTSGCGTYPK